MTRSRLNTLRVACVVVSAALLNACSVSSLLDSNQPIDTIYVLASPPPAATAQPIAADLAITFPRLAPGLGGDRVAVLKGRELNYYYGARWGAELGQVVQNFMVRTLAGQGAFRSVATEDARMTSTYSLALEVPHFQAEYSGADAPQAHVAFIGRVLRVSDRSLVQTVKADALVAAQSNRLSAVIAAFEQAAQQASLELAEQVAAAARADAGMNAAVE
jgi:ABC-type uncharacterized transport system auxiliary subunit